MAEKAGLFSAVPSAFLVESYQALSPDPESQIISLLQQIATQSYTYSGGFLNTTLRQAVFEAPTWTVRVNGLWFASLVVSLTTASFGMLVVARIPRNGLDSAPSPTTSPSVSVSCSATVEDPRDRCGSAAPPPSGVGVVLREPLLFHGRYQRRNAPDEPAACGRVGVFLSRADYSPALLPLGVRSSFSF